MSRYPSDPNSVAAYFNYNTLALDIASSINAAVLRTHIIAKAGDDHERIAQMTRELIDKGAEMFLADPSAVYGNPTVSWKDD